jgi:GrpB-like predicted nucleotidyltransferase (UPF0157 family)
MDESQPAPYRLQPHYCRECGEKFEVIRDNPAASHALVWRHMLAQHRDEVREYVSCSRYCDERAQHEEQTSGRRMYGKGMDKSSPEQQAKHEQQYRDLFPEEAR